MTNPLLSMARSVASTTGEVSVKHPETPLVTDKRTRDKYKDELDQYPFAVNLYSWTGEYLHTYPDRASVLEATGCPDSSLYGYAKLSHGIFNGNMFRYANDVPPGQDIMPYVRKITGSIPVIVQREGEEETRAFRRIGDLSKVIRISGPTISKMLKTGKSKDGYQVYVDIHKAYGYQGSEGVRPEDELTRIDPINAWAKRHEGEYILMDDDMYRVSTLPCASKDCVYLIKLPITSTNHLSLMNLGDIIDKPLLKGTKS